LENLYKRGLENGVTKLSAKEVEEIEPHVRCLAGIQVTTTGIVDYKQVCLKYAELIRAQEESFVSIPKLKKYLKLAIFRCLD